MNQINSIPVEVAGEFKSLFTSLPLEESRFLRDRRPFTVDERDQEWSARDMERAVETEHSLYLYNLECTASKWKRSKAFGEWVARKPENQRYFTRQKPGDSATYRAFSALKGGAK